MATAAVHTQFWGGDDSAGAGITPSHVKCESALSIVWLNALSTSGIP